MRITRLLFCFVSLSMVFYNANAQSNSKKYDSLWKKATDLADKKGLPKSALVEVNKIYALAKKEKQEAQLIKALVWKISLEEANTENASQKTILQLEKETIAATEPSRSILYSILAGRYWNYFQQNRWKLYNRTATVNFKKEDIATWDAGDFHKKISALYLLSLSNEKLLQETSLSSYDPILLKGNMRYLRPTLFDLLANQALDYFRNDERDISKPMYAFEIKDPVYLAPAAEFAHLAIATRDTGSLHHKALLLYQQLLAFHQNDNKPDAMIDADIARIEFVNQYGVMEDKDSLYLQALERLTAKYGQLPAASQAWYLVAQWHAGKAAGYNPLKDTSYRYEYITAKKICETVLAQKDSSEGKANCYNLLNQTLRRSVQLTTEKVNVPSQPFRTLVNYRNIDAVSFRIVPLTDDLRKRLSDNRYSDSYWQLLTTLQPIRSWVQALPSTNDLQQHATEVKVDALPVGNYVLLAGVNDQFSFSKDPIAVQYFYVSNISYINSDKEYFILHRETGKPLAGATVQTWWNKYDYDSRSYKITKGDKYTADNNGYIKLRDHKDKNERSNNLRLEISYEQDRLFLDDEQYIYYSAEYTPEKNYEKENSRVFFFTDRSIYRPGQTVYFKGIVITKDAQTKKNKIISGSKAKLFLYNANDEETDSLELTTNEFGSYSGKFRLPENMLNGKFRIEDDDMKGQANFSVEEYKRPKFQVEYEMLKGTYKVNDSISVTGLAKAYAGNNIDGAQVKYRVVRTARFIYSWLYWGRGYPRSNNMEIANGTATTNDSGKFTIRFKAIPDLTVSRELDPMFDYEVIADVTDVNGETRSATTTVPVSYKALLLKMSSSFGEAIPVDSFKNITITTTNINGTFEPALVKLTIYSLQYPHHLIRSRYWEQPDQHVMSKEEYAQYFPQDEYANETDYHSWNRGEKETERTDSTRRNAAFDIVKAQWKEGWYQAEAVTKDKYGQEVKAMFYFQLYNPRSGMVVPAYIWNDQKNSTIEPSEKSTISIGSSAADLFLIQQVDRQKEKKPEYHFVTLNQQTKEFDFTATEDDRGIFGVTHFFVKDNRFYTVDNNIYVPWTNKELTIAYETYRDKTLPGSEERWKLNISGYKKEKVAAEMLASMYDASLDQYKPHHWSIPSIWSDSYTSGYWDKNNCFSSVLSQDRGDNNVSWKEIDKRYDEFNLPENYYAITTRRLSTGNVSTVKGYYADKVTVSNPLLALQGRVPGLTISQANGIAGAGMQVKIQGQNSIANGTDPLYIIDGVPTEAGNLNPDQIVSIEILKDATATAIYGSRGANGVIIITTKGGKKKPVEEETKVRKNFNETAFFFPDLKTDAAGNIEFSFTMPEALTRWKFQTLTHTKDLAFGYSTKNIITQKELMVQPNAPRFLREGDKMELSAKVVNMTDKKLNGSVQLQLLDAATMQPVDALFHSTAAEQQFSVAAGQSVPAYFTIEVPEHYTSAISYRFIARAGNVSDGEEAPLPVLTNRMLVTESMSLPMRGNTTKSFRFEKLLRSGNSQTLQQRALTVEYTSNPAWYAVQALPYLMEYPYECAEQTFNRFYANALATHIANAVPRLKAVFEKWKTTDTAALLSNLQKNQELKSVLLEETPWVLEAKSEAQQKKNIALLFDMMRMQKEFTASLDKLIQAQTSNGGFSWFKGGPDDRYITQYIVSGIGHLQKLDAIPAAVKEKVNTLLKGAIPYLDNRVIEDYEQLLKWKTNIANNNLGYTQIQYLYMRSFFPQLAIPGNAQTAVNYYRYQSKQYWLQQNKYMQGMIALSLHRNGDKITPGAILASLKENAIVNEELGMYWKQNTGGYYWHEAPVETQSLLIEAFAEIRKDSKTADDLKTWLLKQKQTQSWSTTKATADACYALLLQGSNWLSADQAVEITVGDTKIVSTEVNAESGTGYFKTTFDGASVKPSMGNISVKVSSSASNTLPSWGAVYWQYFENLDKITTASTPLQLNKKLFVEKNTDNGPVLQPVNEGDQLKVGDKIKVRIELRVDRDMEYVHMKDMRAACLEPVNVLSSYRWQGGLGYYESTKDASTNFFFSRLPKGTYVFEYPLFITARGNFSNGITSIQCMYAPEFSSHSEGVRIQVN